jgi:hypothetical protein
MVNAGGDDFPGCCPGKHGSGSWPCEPDISITPLRRHNLLQPQRHTQVDITALRYVFGYRILIALNGGGFTGQYGSHHDRDPFHSC